MSEGGGTGEGGGKHKLAMGTPKRPCPKCFVVYDWSKGGHSCRRDTAEQRSFDAHRKRQWALMERMTHG